MYTYVREQLEAMLECGVIRESNSHHCSPITVVAKKVFFNSGSDLRILADEAV